jgi:hypothetical protein
LGVLIYCLVTLIDPYHYFFGQGKVNPTASELYAEFKYRQRQLPWPEYYQWHYKWIVQLVRRCTRFESDERPSIEEVQKFVHTKINKLCNSELFLS